MSDADAVPPSEPERPLRPSSPTNPQPDVAPPGAPMPPGSGVPPPPTAPPPPSGQTPGGPPASPPPPAARTVHPLKQFVSTTRGKVIVGCGAAVFAGFIAFTLLTTTGVDDIEVGQCFADWDDFDGGRSGDYVPDSVADADCSEPHAVEAYHVTEGNNVFACSALFDDLVIERSTLDFFTITVSGIGGRTTTVICLVGHRDQETLTTGSVLREPAG